MELSLRTLRYFVAAAELASVSAAARRLNISQPSVSAAISQIESALGVQLFFRIPTKGIALTADGSDVLQQARSLLGHAEEFRAFTSAINTDLRGEISLACFINLGPAVMAKLLQSFRERYPDIQVNFRDLDQNEILEELNQGTVELALTFDLDIGQGFASEQVATLPPLAVMAEDDPLAGQTSVDMAEIAARPFILMDLPHTRDYFLSLFRSQGVEPSVAYRCRTFETVRSFAASGMGVSVLNIAPVSPVTYSGRRVVTRPILGKPRPLNVVLLRNTRMRERKIVRLLVDHIRESI